MNAFQHRHYLALTDMARTYARLRAELVVVHEEALEQARVTALQIALADLEALHIHERLRELEGDEEFLAS